MRLTNYLRDAFIRAAMQDVPTIDHAEKIRVLVQKDAEAQLPPKIRAIYQDNAIKHFVTTRYVYANNHSVVVPGCKEGYTPSPKVAEQLQAWALEAKEQTDRNNVLKGHLRGVAYSCKTRKDLVTMLPEFEKYMPADEAAACRTLPALANVVSDFVAAGWPKGKKPEAVAKPATRRTSKK